MLKKLLVALCLLSAAQLPAKGIECGKDGASVVRDNVTWQPIKYTDKWRDLRAELPGNPKKESTTSGMFILSKHDKAEYKVEIYTNEIPQDPKIILAMVNAQKGVKGKILKKYPQKKCSFVIAFERKEKGKVLTVGRIYITKNAAYNFLIQGDLSLAEQVFDSVVIKK